MPPHEHRYPASRSQNESSRVPFRRVALVVHPTRQIDRVIDTLQRWTEAEGLELVQLGAEGSRRVVAPAGAVTGADLVVALGGDGTVLAALRQAADTRTPVLGVACGSLGALSAVTASELDGALDRFRSGDWITHALPALEMTSEAGADWAINDVVLVRGGAGQIAADVMIDDELYVRLAGDGVIVATPLGSSAYSLAAGGAILPTGTQAFLCTPLAMHAGSAPPLVVPAGATLCIDVDPGYAGFDVEIDGQRRHLDGTRFSFVLHEDRVNLVGLATAGRGLAGLRRRGIVADSPRIAIRDSRSKPDCDR
jgi:NAD+ kinase